MELNSQQGMMQQTGAGVEVAVLYQTLEWFSRLSAVRNYPDDIKSLLKKGISDIRRHINHCGAARILDDSIRVMIPAEIRKELVNLWESLEILENECATRPCPFISRYEKIRKSNPRKPHLQVAA